MGSHSTIDLHLHTHYSDGRASPAEVLEQAVKLGLSTIAITDHDNARGAREARPLAPQLGVELIPAIEFTSRWDKPELVNGDRDIDVLGYFVDLDDPGFRAAEQAALADMQGRVADCCARLSAAGYPLTVEQVLAENPRYPGALQTILALITQGHADGWHAAFELFVAQWRQVRLCRTTIDRAIAAIHAAGGVAVLAHPAAIPWSDGWLQAEQIAELVDMGLDGIEVYHFRLDPEARAHFMGLARHFDLVITGGSDMHGWPTGFARMGQEPVTPEIVEALRKRRAKTRRKPVQMG